MAECPTCGGRPIDGVVTTRVGNSLSLTLVRSPSGYCFSSWGDYYGNPGPAVDDALRTRVFPSIEDATAFFQQLCSVATPAASLPIRHKLHTQFP